MTKGERLYLHKHPRHVTLYTTRAPWGSAVSVPVDGHTPYRLLTLKCRETWERQAVGHWIFSGEADAFKLDSAT